MNYTFLAHFYQNYHLKNERLRLSVGKRGVAEKLSENTSEKIFSVRSDSLGGGQQVSGE
jgi:hypothetical protein